MKIDRASFVTGLRTKVRRTRGRVLRARHLQGDQRDGEDDPGEGQQRCRDGRQERPRVVQVGREHALVQGEAAEVARRQVPATQAAKAATAGQSQSDSRRHSRRCARRDPPGIATRARPVVTGRLLRSLLARRALRVRGVASPARASPARSADRRAPTASRRRPAPRRSAASSGAPARQAS